MQGEELWKQDKSNMPGFLGQFCRTTLPWYFLGRFERQKFENEAVYYSDGVVALTENGKRIIRKGDFVLREDDNLFVPALWNGKEIIAYSGPGYENKAWRMPDDWNGVKCVDLYQITLEGCVPLKKDVPVTAGKLVLSLANNGQAVSIVPAGTRLAGRVVASLAADSLPVVETKEQRDARMAWWRDARFGMFIHWGLYAIPAQGEWYMNDKVPVAEYAKYAAQYNPVKFEARLWVRIAKESGMKYMVLTAKHHDGFAMFATAASRFNIVDATPFKRDVVKELAQACRDAGLKFGVYYSNGQDWHHPGGGKLKQWDPAQAGDEDQFIKTIVVPQVHELLHNYGLLDLFWWDSSVDLWSPQHPNRAARLYEEFKPFPKLLINNRLYDCYRNLQFKPEFWKTADPLERFIRGDYATPETEFPGSVPEGIDWETCDSAGGGWGYVKGGQAKPVADLVHNLIDVASKGGNYLLNVGPDAEGVIPPTHVDSLRGVGNWLRVNGEAIYGTSASRLPKVPWGRITRKPGKLYLHVFAWPTDGTLRVPLQDKVRSAVLLAEPQRQLPIQQTAEELVITLPAEAPDRIASVVVLE